MEELKKGSYMINLIDKEDKFSGSILYGLKGDDVRIWESRAWKVAVIQTRCKDSMNLTVMGNGKEQILEVLRKKWQNLKLYGSVAQRRRSQNVNVNVDRRLKDHR